METKTFEIRDEGTFIPVLAIRLNPENNADRFLLAQSGYGRTPAEQGKYVIMMPLNDVSMATYDPFKIDRPGGTYFVAYEYIKKNFETLESGAVVDVEFIKGLTPAPKISERSMSLFGE
jgi:hypothetical protein